MRPTHLPYLRAEHEAMGGRELLWVETGQGYRSMPVSFDAIFSNILHRRFCFFSPSNSQTVAVVDPR